MLCHLNSLELADFNTGPAEIAFFDLNARELVCLVPIVLLCFWIGLYPAPVFRVLEKPVNYVVSKVDPSFAQTTAERGGGVELDGELAGE